MFGKFLCIFKQAGGYCRMKAAHESSAGRVIRVQSGGD